MTDKEIDKIIKKVKSEMNTFSDEQLDFANKAIASKDERKLELILLNVKREKYRKYPATRGGIRGEEMKIVCYTEPKENGVLLQYPSLAVKQKMLEIYNLAKEKSNGYMTVDIARVYKSRSNEQNRMFWGIVQQIAQETGNDLEDVEEAVKERALKRGFPAKENKLTGRLKPLSMTKVNTVEMGYLLEEVQQLASELGIVLDPDLNRQNDLNDLNDSEKSNSSDVKENLTTDNLAEKALYDIF